MRNPATPTPSDRAEIRRLAAAVIDSVKADGPMAHGLTYYADGFDIESAEDLIFRLCEEVVRLRSEMQAAAPVMLTALALIADEADEAGMREMALWFHNQYRDHEDDPLTLWLDTERERRKDQP